MCLRFIHSVSERRLWGTDSLIKDSSFNTKITVAKWYMAQTNKSSTVAGKRQDSANLEDSAVVAVLEKVSFHSNPKERQCQRMLKLPHSCTHLTRWQSNAQNSPSQALTVSEPRTSRYSSWI